jgi:hypothetical protein
MAYKIPFKISQQLRNPKSVSTTFFTSQLYEQKRSYPFRLQQLQLANAGEK